MTSETKQMVAKRIMREADLVQEEEYDAIVLHGEQISEMDDEAWDHVFTKKEIIFARTSPSQKLEIVKRAQALGHIVGVTGDGVNDAPALKRADLGIAMNVSGSDVSKEAASMILLDDNFVSIVRGIEEGRLIFSNLKKSIRYTLTHAMPEILPQLLLALVPIPLPLPSILILLIDLGFELLAALSYAWDPPETSTGLMKLLPRKPVNQDSIARLRRMEDRELQPRFDFEARSIIPPSRTDRFFHAIRLRFSPAYWRDRLDPNSEVMVDSQVLSWAFLEAGLIETGVCLATFFAVLKTHGVSIHDSHTMQVRGLFKSGSDSHTVSTGTNLDDQQQLEALAQAQSGYFIALIIMQCFNLFACKSKLCVPWGRHMFQNWRNFAGIGLGLLLSLLVIYVPPLATLFQTSPGLNPTVALTIPLAGGFFLLIYATLRHLVLKRANPANYSPNIIGLKMHPTVFNRPNRNF
ncbi:hypothetical protein DSO57_1020076 [Entomophthora muscae]|uniref:Uncharacterized protein n=1 Tax=Entomophthora muscae TaxID=34485 RepID=A0ACC2SGS7_9FUNG|nr:hypothetical protein DSO57_1020076 [Entomophthora muscae]